MVTMPSVTNSGIVEAEHGYEMAGRSAAFLVADNLIEVWVRASNPATSSVVEIKNVSRARIAVTGSLTSATGGSQPVNVSLEANARHSIAVDNNRNQAQTHMLMLGFAPKAAIGGMLMLRIVNANRYPPARGGIEYNECFFDGTAMWP